MHCAVIDIGSNTIRLCLYNWDGQQIQTLFSKKETVGLVGYVKNGTLSQKGIQSCINTLQAFKELAQNFKPDAFLVFATASLRNIENTDQALRQIKEATGIEVDVILGREEARLDFVGATQATDMSEGLLVDIGGGSIELVSFQNHVMQFATSIDVGSLSLFTKHVELFFPDKFERHEIKKEVKQKLMEIPELQNQSFHTICGVGGTIRNTGKLYNFAHSLGNTNRIYPASAVKDFLKRFKNPDKEALQFLLRVAPDRVHTIVPGMLALQVIIRYFGVQEIQVSPFGVREGYLFDRILKGGTPNAQS